MSRTVLVGVVLFVLGVIAGRMSVLMASPSPVAASSSPSPTPVPVSAAQPGGVLRGRIAEVIQVPQYTYLRLESGEWAAVDSAPQLAQGAEVSLQLQNEMQDFVSTSLNRTFARLWFATLEGAAPVVKVAAPPNVTGDDSVQKALAAVEAGNALTMRVADVFAERAVLSGKRVRVSGKVDRVNVVQGLHYVHLKDGTGVAAEKTDDLLCITDVDVAAGTTLAMEGVVAVDKNVGMGINPVVLDGARVAK
ncbi:MAG: hypothetical protein JNM17_14945 [Archangium sp.]|nr:hypothetical protein [Archangium sp.]